MAAEGSTAEYATVEGAPIEGADVVTTAASSIAVVVNTPVIQAGASIDLPVVTFNLSVRGVAISAGPPEQFGGGATAEGSTAEGATAGEEFVLGVSMLLDTASRISILASAPTIQAGSSTQPPAGLVSIAAHPPIIQTGVNAAIEAGVISVLGVAPSISTGVLVVLPEAPQIGVVANPTIEQAGKSVLPDSHAITIEGGSTATAATAEYGTAQGSEEERGVKEGLPPIGIKAYAPKIQAGVNIELHAVIINLSALETQQVQSANVWMPTPPPIEIIGNATAQQAGTKVDLTPAQIGVSSSPIQSQVGVNVVLSDPPQIGVVGRETIQVQSATVTFGNAATIGVVPRSPQPQAGVNLILPEAALIGVEANETEEQAGTIIDVPPSEVQLLTPVVDIHSRRRRVGIHTTIS